MSLVINTNVSSLNAQNNLTKSKNALAMATQRLSSGLKINSAADNAAGFAISQRYTTQVGGLTQASANASDAINLAQTAGSALDQVTANLQAIRDLAVQSANGTYTSADRSSIDQEVQQRLAEITRIANQTTFNGSKVLDGSMQTKSFQIGADVGQTISVNLGTSVKASDMGKIAEVNTSDLSGAFTDATGKSYTMDLSKITVTGTDGTAVALSGTASSVQDLADAINAKGIAGVSAAVDGKGGLSVFSNGSFKIADTGSINAASTLGATQTKITGVATDVGAGAAYTDGAAVATAGSLNGSDVKTVDNANALISRVDVALKTVSDFAAQLGAVQNRFQSTISTVAAQTTNLQASQSTIQDADFASETANLSKAQVLQQAGISVLAQANSNPQQVLKLLQ
ncbi:flagellin [Dyella jiangningensis]|uniref:flagellin N-terminal helical domain-containing protein n=1 Tax=Dyella jiangningensis TaxID=1379159 RepID=UPI0004561DCD|nr:flagellin [Dyella jiangningensis]AHX14402.1 flagellin [Dyella jiangningensis]MDG2538173.1 flagellin [Dyella jiangningensis]